MRLLGDHFKIIESSEEENQIDVRIEFNSAHIVYLGHFPGNPVTPGVIQMQIVHELIENHIDKSLKLKGIRQCKFLKILDPNVTPQISVHIELANKEDGFDVKAHGKNDADIYFKLISSYKL